MSALARAIVAGDAAATFPKGLVAVNDNPKPTPSELRMAELLGEMKGELTGIKTMLNEMKDDADVATQSRAQLHEKLNLATNRITNLESTVTVLGGVVAKQTSRVDKIEPIALWLIAIATGLFLVGGALWYGVLNYGQTVLRWLSSILPNN